uniref:Uncharacterized protein n=1 Tax=Arundo donax TaxID=35708 RepID=A0A0A9GHM8_ARUDO
MFTCVMRETTSNHARRSEQRAWMNSLSSSAGNHQTVHRTREDSKSSSTPRPLFLKAKSPASHRLPAYIKTRHGTNDFEFRKKKKANIQKRTPELSSESRNRSDTTNHNHNHTSQTDPRRSNHYTPIQQQEHQSTNRPQKNS